MQAGSVETAPGPASAPTRLARLARRAGRGIGRADRLTARVPPWAVLGPLVVLGWIVVAYIAHVAVHTGPVYYNSGDGSWYYTTAWVLGRGQIPYSAIGYGYPLLLSPLARIAGPNIVGGLPYVIALNVLVLGPIALLCVYGIAKGIAGRRFAYLVSLLWVLAPVIGIHYILPDYHRRYVGLTLPAVLGLTTLGDFPSMVAVLVSAYFAFRTIAFGRDIDAVTSGLAAGLAIAVKPANGTFLPALFLALVVARRPRAFVAAALGILPCLLCLAVWKDRGVGDLPLFSHAQAMALGAGSPPVGLTVHMGHYLRFDWGRFSNNIDGLREYTWSRRLIEWSVIAGLVALFRRSAAVAVLVGGWLAVYLFLKGGTVADFNGGSFFRYLAPGFPAAFLLAASLPLLMPIAGRRLAASGTLATWPQTPRARRAVLGAGLVLGIAPLVPLLAFPQQTAPIAATIPDQTLFIPVNRFDVQAQVHGSSVQLTWPDEKPNGARIKYEVFRSPVDTLSCQRLPGASALCQFPDGQAAVELRSPHWTDRPGAGNWVYRVVVVSGAPPPSGMSNAVLVSRPAAVTVS